MVTRFRELIDSRRIMAKLLRDDPNTESPRTFG